MKSKRGLLLLLILLLLLGGLYWQFFLKKKAEKKAPARPQAAVDQPLPTTKPVVPPPTAAPVPPAVPPALPGMPTPRPGTPASPLPMAPTASPMPAIPRARQVPAETQPIIQVLAGPPIKIAEGTTFLLEQTQVLYGGKKPLQYQWELLEGPAEKIEIRGDKDLQAMVVLGELETPTQFRLKLSATDGLSKTSGEISLTGVPAKLDWVGRVGGAVVGIRSLGNKWVSARGHGLQIFSTKLEPLKEISLESEVTEFFTILDKQGKGAVYVKSPEGQWAVVQSDPVEGSRVSRLPMLGRQIRKGIPFELEGETFFFALLEKNIEIWNLTEPRRPRLKSSLTTQLNQPEYLAFFGPHLYVADEQSLNTLESSTGNVLASIPSGGSVTTLQTYSLGTQNFLVAAIGKDRSSQNRQDYGLRVWEISSSGRLGEGKRYPVGGGLPVEYASLLNGTTQMLLAVQGEEGVQFKLWDLKAQKEIPLKGTESRYLLGLAGMETGKWEDQAVVLFTDGNRLSLLSLVAETSPTPTFELKPVVSIPGIFKAAWVQARPDGSLLWVGDEGGAQGGSMVWVRGQPLRVEKALSIPGRFPVAADFKVSQSPGLVLLLRSDAQAPAAESPMGSVGLVSQEAAEPGKMEMSGEFLGLKSPKGEVLPLGIAGHHGEQGLFLTWALSRLSGSAGYSGLGWTNNFTVADPAKGLEIIGLQDARDVALTADGSAAFLASGVAGVIGVDLKTKSPVSRMSLGSPDWFADRVRLSHGGHLLLVAFVNRKADQVILKIFGTGKDLQMAEYGTITGLKPVQSAAGMRAPGFAFTHDDLFLFVPLDRKELALLNFSNPASPFKVASRALPGEIQDVAVASKFKDVFVALGKEGLAKLEFDFMLPEIQPETQPAPVPPTQAATPQP